MLAGHLSSAAGACVLTLLLVVTAGCSSGRVENTDPSPTDAAPAPTAPSSTAAEPADPLPPQLPAEAQQDTTDGASAFARHYWATVNHATATGDTAPLSALGADNCAACEDIEKDIAALHRENRSAIGGRAIVQDVSPRPGDPVAGLITKVLLQQESGRVIDASGRTVSTSEASDPFLIDMVLIWRQGAWTVTEWGASSAPE